MRESTLQTSIVRYLKGRGVYVYNAAGSASSAKGTSDLLVCYRGRFLSIELKKPNGSYGVTKPQEIRQRQVREAGGLALTATSIEDVAVALDSIDRKVV